MIVFANEKTREEFHLLPTEKQVEIQKMADRREAYGEALIVKAVYRWTEKESEIVLDFSKDFIRDLPLLGD